MESFHNIFCFRELVLQTFSEGRLWVIEVAMRTNNIYENIMLFEKDYRFETHETSSKYNC